jgi:predicted short-subunit dehydrogenase-like oxidoreductase (DUF2520 family)
MESQDRPTIGFIGAGVVGSGLARALTAAGYTVTAIHSRTAKHREALAEALPEAAPFSKASEAAAACDLVFLTVPDDAIALVADSIPWRKGRRVVHCDGARSIELLETARGAGAEVGVFHPLQSFASVEQALSNIPGSTFAIDASSPELLETLRQMAVALRGNPLVIQGDRAVYHASAVLACNYLVTLLDIASQLWRSLGLTKEEGLRALLPLVRGTVENLERIGLPGALTGPIARGDAGTIQRHLTALDAVAPEVLPVYKELARRTIPVALAKGRIDEHAAEALSEALDRDDGGEKP